MAIPHSNSLEAKLATVGTSVRQHDNNTQSAPLAWQELYFTVYEIRPPATKFLSLVDKFRTNLDAMYPSKVEETL